MNEKRLAIRASFRTENVLFLELLEKIIANLPSVQLVAIEEESSTRTHIFFCTQKEQQIIQGFYDAIQTGSLQVIYSDFTAVIDKIGEEEALKRMSEGITIKQLA